MLGILFFGCLGGALAGIKDKQELFGEISPPALDIHDAKAIQTMCDQKLDHFDKENKKTWCQRYVLNASLHQTGGPVFICIDGEDYPWNSGRRPYTLAPSASIASLLESFEACNNMVELAQSFGAMMLGLEHRYYGGAAFDGVPNFSTANLKYLSSRQALADLAQFHAFWLIFYIKDEIYSQSTLDTRIHLQHAFHLCVHIHMYIYIYLFACLLFYLC